MHTHTIMHAAKTFFIENFVVMHVHNITCFFGSINQNFARKASPISDLAFSVASLGIP